MTKPSRDWFEHAVPNGRKWALCYYAGRYFVAQYNPPTNTWLYYADNGALVQVEPRYISWRPFPDPPDGDDFVTNKTHCLESDPDFD